MEFKIRKMRILLFIIINVSILFIVGCTADKNSPEAITKEFVTLMSTGDKSAAAALGTDRTLRYLDFREQSMEMLGENTIQPIDVQSVECFLENDTANCLFCCDQNGEKEMIPLTKINNTWKVDINIDEMIKELEEAMQNLEKVQEGG